MHTNVVVLSMIAAAKTLVLYMITLIWPEVTVPLPVQNAATDLLTLLAAALLPGDAMLSNKIGYYVQRPGGERRGERKDDPAPAAAPDELRG